jgi:hypothetical protein
MFFCCKENIPTLDSHVNHAISVMGKGCIFQWAGHFAALNFEIIIVMK